MAKKAAQAVVAAQGPVRICFERIVPDDLLPNRAMRDAFREQVRAAMAAGPDAALSADDAHVARLAVVISKKWQQGQVINCRFLDGTPTQRKRVEAKAHEWEKYANIKLKFITAGPAEIRISFAADPGSWSAVGTDALISQYFPLHQPTMNYGWLKDGTDDEEYSRVVIHEFGHALGAIHEHQSPKFTRKWNKAAVYAYFSGPPNYWSKGDIDFNVLQKYSPQGIKATQFDPASIMLYHFDAALFADGKGPTNENTKPSALDISLMKQMYPKP